MQVDFIEQMFYKRRKGSLARDNIPESHLKTKSIEISTDLLEDRDEKKITDQEQPHHVDNRNGAFDHLKGLATVKTTEKDKTIYPRREPKSPLWCKINAL